MPPDTRERENIPASFPSDPEQPTPQSMPPVVLVMPAPSPEVVARESEQAAVEAGMPELSARVVVREAEQALVEAGIPALSAEVVARESERAAVEIVIPDDLLIQLLELSDRFVCAIEMATFLAMMRIGGAQLFLSFKHELDAGMLDSLQKLAQTCRDELEFVSLLYALGSPSEKHAHLQAPAWATSFLACCLQVYNVEHERERLLAVVTKNKREQRMLDFNLLDRVRIVLLSHLSAENGTDEAALLAAVSVKPEWQQWSQQTPHTPIELAKIISLHTRTRTGSLVENIMSWHFPMEPDQPPATNYSWMETMSRYQKAVVPELLGYGGSEQARIDGREVDVKALALLHAGDLITVEVTGVQEYGVFVKAESGIEGLIRKSKIWGSPENVSDYFNKGDIITASILDIDMRRSRLELSTQPPAYDPLLKYSPGDTPMGKITRFLYYGMIVEIELGVKGLIHNNDMRQPISKMQDRYRVGSEIEVLVISVEMEKRHLSLADADQL